MPNRTWILKFRDRTVGNGEDLLNGIEIGVVFEELDVGAVRFRARNVLQR